MMMIGGTTGFLLGWNLFGFALGPSAILITISYVFPKVWYVSCASCRKIFYRRPSAERWKVAIRSKKLAPVG